MSLFASCFLNGQLIWWTVKLFSVTENITEFNVNRIFVHLLSDHGNGSAYPKCVTSVLIDELWLNAWMDRDVFWCEHFHVNGIGC